MQPTCDGDAETSVSYLTGPANEFHRCRRPIISSSLARARRPWAAVVLKRFTALGRGWFLRALQVVSN